jgi:hypothetical protein
LNVDEGFFSVVERELSEAFFQAGVYQVGLIPATPLPDNGTKLVVRFKGRHPRAETFLAQQSSTLITGILDEQRDLIREVLRKGIEKGQSPLKTALDIAGRMKNGKRTGGIIGLDSKKAEWLQSSIDELSDPAKMPNYLKRKLRDKRFDGIVKRAIRDDKPLKVSDVRKISSRYSDRLLKHRADVIARTETLKSLNAGKYEALEQIVDTGRIEREQIVLVWHDTGDSKTRDSHAKMGGQKIKLGEAFVSPTGARLKFPTDTSLGATGEDVIQCRCWMETRIDYLSRAV